MFCVEVYELVGKYAAMAAGAPQKSPQQLWEDHLPIAREILADSLPAPVKELGEKAIHFYCEQLLPHLFHEFLHTVAARDPSSGFRHWLDHFIRTFVERKMVPLVPDSQLTDEELVRLCLHGSGEAQVALSERYEPKIKKTVGKIVYANNICPKSHDVVAFIEDIASAAKVKMLVELASYRFESPFEHWMGVICYNEAYTQQRKIIGQGPEPRTYISWEEYRENSEPLVISDVKHRELLRRLIDKHGKTRRGKKSKAAILLTYFEGMEAKEDHLISHDYKKLRLDLEAEGISGKDL